LLFNAGPQTKEILLSGGTIEETLSSLGLKTKIEQITLEQPITLIIA
jgi:hypothetical protein